MLTDYKYQPIGTRNTSRLLATVRSEFGGTVRIGVGDLVFALGEWHTVRGIVGVGKDAYVSFHGVKVHVRDCLA